MNNLFDDVLDEMEDDDNEGSFVEELQKKRVGEVYAKLDLCFRCKNLHHERIIATETDFFSCSKSHEGRVLGYKKAGEMTYLDGIPEQCPYFLEILLEENGNEGEKSPKEPI